MSKKLSMQIFWAISFVLIGFVLGYLGIFALQKSMTIKMTYTVNPNIRCEIWMHTDADGQVGGEDIYNKIFSNKSGEEFVAGNITLNTETSTLTLPNNFRGGIGAGFDLKIFNYTTNTPIFVSSQGEGVSLHSVVCAGFVSGTPTPQILSVSSVLGTANIVFETEFYQVSFNNPALSFDNANSSVAEFDGNYYISAKQQLSGNIFNNYSYFVLNSIQINTTTYNSTQIATWRTENILTIPNDIAINGAITINATTYHRVSFNRSTFSLSSSNTVIFDNNYYLQTGQQLTGTITTSVSGNIIIHTIYIGETEYYYSQVYSWINSSNVLTIPNTITINGDVNIYGYVGDYTRLSYLQSTGTQYINTNYNDDDNLAISCEFEIVTCSYNSYLYGSQQNEGAFSYNGLYIRNDANGTFSLEYNWSQIFYVDCPSRILMKQTIIENINTIIVNDNTYTSTTSNSNNTRMLFFACYNRYGDLRLFSGTINCYFFKIVNDNVLVRNYIPLLRTSDSKPGMLDLVNNVFYTNADETVGADDFDYE